MAVAILPRRSCLGVHTVLTDLQVPVVPFYPVLGEDCPTERHYRKKGTLTLTFLLEDLVTFGWLHRQTKRGTNPC